MATVVTDPYDYKVVGYEPLNLRADIVSISQVDATHNKVSVVKSKPRVISGPGEFEIGGVFITAIQTNGGKRKKNEMRNILFVFDYSGLTVAHLGNIRRVPSQSQVEALGTVNVALVPVGAGNGLNAAKAAEVVSLLEPGIVIPMQYKTPKSKIPLDSLDKFIKEMGLGNVEPISSLKVSVSGVPSETKVVVLDFDHN
jgi:L-ascorbate metabolism protein UlaG (beta-lactamase superfamily)